MEAKTTIIYVIFPSKGLNHCFKNNVRKHAIFLKYCSLIGICGSKSRFFLKKK